MGSLFQGSKCNLSHIRIHINFFLFIDLGSSFAPMALWIASHPDGSHRNAKSRIVLPPTDFLKQKLHDIGGKTLVKESLYVYGGGAAITGLTNSSIQLRSLVKVADINND